MLIWNLRGLERKCDQFGTGRKGQSGTLRIIRVRTYPAEHDLGYKGTSAQKVAKLTSRQRHPSNEMCFGKLTRGTALSRTSLKTLFKEWDDFNGVLTRETLFFTYNEAAAAERNELEYPRSKKPFRSYALLGDDIVISDERVALRLCGAGYRVRSRLAKPSKKQKDGKGCLIVEKVLSRMKPKQLELVPDEYCKGDNYPRIINEYTLVHNWLKEWLRLKSGWNGCSIEPLYLPWISRVPLNKGFSWVPTWKSIPNDDGQFAGRKAVPKILTNMRSFAFDIRVIHGFQDGVFSPAVDLKDGPWTAIFSCDQDGWLVRAGKRPIFAIGPIHRLSQKPPLEVDSFDLSSATDRWPVPVIHDVIACLFGPASCIVNGSLALCVGPPLVGKFRTIYDVSISEAKSLQSKTGALEFAKQLWVDRVQVNLTPVSAKALLGATTLIGLCQLAEKYGLSRTSLFSLAGAGYRVRARLLSHHLSRRWKRLRADKSLTYLRLPLDLWLNPTNPYLKGIIVEKVRRVSQAIGLIPR
ncbi:hypothetical protein ZIOFF_075497 [Zingiber officinale]|uniref:Uncharacterized protein n=1 Tax=Zingiber officinale TaxID=94328 RepID=A0A8J5BT79_ZINOF|nr:hypothetical protein ZIOFF_075497 [Zingiber officinale]